jgi:hypothetical protein
VATKEDHTDNRPVFVGMDAVFKLIGALFRRPRFRDPARRLDPETGRWRNDLNRRERSDRKGLPMVCLVRPHGPDNLLNEIRELLEQAKPHSVRHAYVSLGQSNSTDEPVTEPKRWAVDDVSAVRKILRDARNELVRSHRSKDRRLRFPLFSLVDWLMDQKNIDDQDQEGELRRWSTRSWRIFVERTGCDHGTYSASVEWPIRCCCWTTSPCTTAAMTCSF